jgi:hypothetical protein
MPEAKKPENKEPKEATKDPSELEDRALAAASDRENKESPADHTDVDRAAVGVTWRQHETHTFDEWAAIDPAVGGHAADFHARFGSRAHQLMDHDTLELRLEELIPRRRV